MTRPKEFSEDEALHAAAQVFTRLGYSATSLSTLTEELGVAKQSLYNAFGDKESLYLRTLQHASQDNPLGRVLAQPHKTGLQRMQAFFDQLCAECNDADHPGCMVCTGILEQPPGSALRHALQAKWQATHELLRSTIEDGQRDGSIRSKKRSADLAHTLMATMAGMRVMRKALNDNTALKAALKQISALHLEMLAN
jgi:TetR/AcrR family transcriptional regulator, transcriptional repressor for nem operon